MTSILFYLWIVLLWAGVSWLAASGGHYEPLVGGGFGLLATLPIAVMSARGDLSRRK